MAINNPYVPGDPACYDLKWLVGELKKVQTYQVEEAVTAAAASASSAADSAEDAEAWAKGTRDGVDVVEIDRTYHNNSKWFAEKAADNAEDAEAWAKGTRDGVAVAEDDATYHKNSKYYADEAQNDADNASASADESEAWAVGTKNGTPVSSGAAQYNNNAKYWAQQAGQSQGSSIFGITTEYLDSLTLSHTEWGYRYGTVSTDGILLISLSMQESNSNQIGELVVNIAKMNGTTPIEYAIAQETGSGDADRWTAVETAAFMKVNAGDRIRLGCYRHTQISGTPTMVADTNIIAIGTTITLDAAFVEPPLTLGAIRGVGQLSSRTLEKEEK